MPSYSLNNFTAPDLYLPQGATVLNGAAVLTGPATLDSLPLLDHININVGNAAIYYSLQLVGGLSANKAGAFQPETFLIPGFLIIQRKGVVGIRIRAAVLATNLPPGGTQAQVTVEAVEA